MEQGKTRRVNMRSKLFGALFVISLIFIMVSVTFSWFTTGKQASVSGIQMQVETTYNLKHSIPEVVWGENSPLKPITGDGMNFFLPVFEKQEVSEGSGVYDELPSQTEFVSVDKTDLPNYMYRLDLTLSVEGLIEGSVDLYFNFTEDNNFIRPASDNNDGKYGYSPDNACAAVRVAFIQDGEIKCIWIPNTTTELKNKNGERELLLENGICESQYIFRYENDGQKASSTNSVIIDTDNQPNGSFTDEETGIVYVWGDITETNCPTIAQLVPGDNEMSILVWLEGTDRECDISMSEGKIDANICLAITSGEFE